MSAAAPTTDHSSSNNRGYPIGSGSYSSDSNNNSGEVVAVAADSSFSSSATSGIGSASSSIGGGGGGGGGGGEAGSDSSSLHQRLAVAGVTTTASAGVSREQGVRDLRSIIQFPLPHVTGLPVLTMNTPTSSQGNAAVISASQLVSAAVSGTLSQAGGGGSGQAASSQFQRLKVEDALSYLDQVKLQFGNQPQVYNDFLDIMKEFKSQSIDTPGVISRVSNLFKGHPDLIVGFNTFLPPGFKIEVHQNEINISGPAQHSQTLAKIAQAHNSSQAASLNAASTNSSMSPGHSASGSTSAGGKGGGQNSAAMATSTAGGQQGTGHQPVEFNHAINYVNKIKNRFQQHPDIYKAFLEILHKYQKEQRILKEGGGVNILPLTESEVYSQVSSLFQNQEDLLAEFSQFLPEATAYTSSLSLLPALSSKKPVQGSATGKGSKGTRKASQSGTNSSGSHAKKPKNSAKDVLAEAGKHANYAELALFDNIRKFLHDQDVYDNFLRCLMLFNEEIISRHELVQLVTPFLGKFPELFSSFKTLLGFKDPSLPEQLPTNPSVTSFQSKERVNEFAAELDYKNLKRHGASYRALPKSYVQPTCSGRSGLCREVLNDTWVSFPMWSEDSTFEGTRKTQFEEYIFRCEDERFELDVVLEMNLATIRYLEALQKKMSKMSPDELSNFTLDDTLSGQSEVLQRKAVHRIYGEKANDIIEGVKKSPSVAVPIVLKRLKGKQEEWREAQKSFNKTWRDQLEKYYLKSLDHQGINFKQVDTRAMRSKSLITEIEALFDERQEQMVDGASPTGPNLTLPFPDSKCIMEDAAGLIMYYTKIASSLSHSDALKIRSFLTRTIPDFCYYPRVEISKEDDLSAESDSDAMDVDTVPQDNEEKLAPKQQQQQQPAGGGSGASSKVGCSFVTPEPLPQFAEMDYHLLYANNSIYTFFRLLQFLCERLNRIYQHALSLIEEEESQSLGAVSSGGEAISNGGEEGLIGGGIGHGRNSVAVKLGLRKMPDIQVDQHYPTYLSMAKNFMEGNIDSNTYEDTCREMFGVHAYVVFTIDRLMQNIVRQLQMLMTDESCIHILECYSSFVEQLTSQHLRAESRVSQEMAYQAKAEALVRGDNCFKITLDKKERKLSMELLDTDEAAEENTTQDIRKWELYVEKYSCQEEETPLDLKSLLAKRKIFLKRSLRQCGRQRESLSPSAASSTAEEDAKLESLLPSMTVCGTIEFKMDKKSYRMIPLANSEDYLYNMATLTKARMVNPSVTKRQVAKWQRFHTSWLDSNAGSGEVDKCQQWFLGAELGAELPSSLKVVSECSQEEWQGQKVNKYRQVVAESAISQPAAPEDAMETA